MWETTSPTVWYWDPHLPEVLIPQSYLDILKEGSQFTLCSSSLGHDSTRQMHRGPKTQCVQLGALHSSSTLLLFTHFFFQLKKWQRQPFGCSYQNLGVILDLFPSFTTDIQCWWVLSVPFSSLFQIWPSCPGSKLTMELVSPLLFHLSASTLVPLPQPPHSLFSDFKIYFTISLSCSRT